MCVLIRSIILSIGVWIRVLQLVSWGGVSGSCEFCSDGNILSIILCIILSIIYSRKRSIILSIILRCWFCCGIFGKFLGLNRLYYLLNT